jgi:hypothetical protein
MAVMPHRGQRIGNLPYLNIAHRGIQEIPGDARRFPVLMRYRTAMGRGFPGFGVAHRCPGRKGFWLRAGNSALKKMKKNRLMGSEWEQLFPLAHSKIHN